MARNLADEVIIQNTHGLRQVLSAKAAEASAADTDKPFLLFVTYIDNGDGTGFVAYQTPLADGHTYEYRTQNIPLFAARQQALAMNPSLGGPLVSPNGGEFYNAFSRNALSWDKIFLF